MNQRFTPQDPYRSRTVARWEIAPRVDPVVYPGGSGPLSDEQLAAYDRDGFLFLPTLLTEEEVRDALAAAERAAEEQRGAPEVIAEPGSDVVRSLFRAHAFSDVLGRLVRHPFLRGAAEQILASRVTLHQSRVNFKPALDGQGFFWHSDFETWHVEDGMPRMRALSVSISLTATTQFNGPLMLVPGSHRRYVRCVGETPPEHYKQSLRRQEIGTPDAEALEALIDEGGLVAPTGGPGSVVLFDCNTMHGSTGNLSPHPRTNLFFVYNSVENALVAPFGGTEPRPEYIAARGEGVVG